MQLSFVCRRQVQCQCLLIATSLGRFLSRICQQTDAVNSLSPILHHKNVIHLSPTSSWIVALSPVLSGYCDQCPSFHALLHHHRSAVSDAFLPYLTLRPARPPFRLRQVSARTTAPSHYSTSKSVSVLQKSFAYTSRANVLLATHEAWRIGNLPTAITNVLHVSHARDQRVPGCTEQRHHLTDSITLLFHIAILTAAWKLTCVTQSSMYLMHLRYRILFDIRSFSSSPYKNVVWITSCVLVWIISSVWIV